MILYLTIQAALLVVFAYAMITWLRYQGRQIDWLKRQVDNMQGDAEPGHPEPDDTRPASKLYND